MAGPVTDTHRITYRENFQLALQEKKRTFDAGFSDLAEMSGKQVQITDLIGSIEARLDAPEGGDTPDLEGSHEPVWVRPRRIDWGKLLKVEDYIKATTDYKNQYTQAGVNGIVRRHNQIQADAIFGPRLIGNEVPVSTPWAGAEVAITYGGAGPSVGMNVKKLLAGIKLMEDHDIDVTTEELYCGCDPQEILDLYNDITYVNTDYRSKSVLEEKRVLSILGITILPTKRIADKAANQSRAALWCKSGLWWGPFMPLSVQSSPNPAKQFREQVYAEEWEGATRTEDFKVVSIVNVY